MEIIEWSIVFLLLEENLNFPRVVGDIYIFIIGGFSFAETLNENHEQTIKIYK